MSWEWLMRWVRRTRWWQLRRGQQIATEQLRKYLDCRTGGHLFRGPLFLDSKHGRPARTCTRCGTVRVSLAGGEWAYIHPDV